MHWTQNYDPLGAFSPLVAGLPIVLLLGLLATNRVSAPMAALAGLAPPDALLCQPNLLQF